jgi:hypothetical protein
LAELAVFELVLGLKLSSVLAVELVQEAVDRLVVLVGGCVEVLERNCAWDLADLDLEVVLLAAEVARLLCFRLLSSSSAQVDSVTALVLDAAVINVEVDVDVLLDVGPVKVDLLFDRQLVAEQGVVVSLEALVLLCERLAHGRALVDAGDAEEEVHAAVALDDGLDDVAVLEAQRVEGDLGEVVFTRGFETLDGKLVFLANEAVPNLVKVELELDHRLSRRSALL